MATLSAGGLSQWICCSVQADNQPVQRRSCQDSGHDFSDASTEQACPEVVPPSCPASASAEHYAAASASLQSLAEDSDLCQLSREAAECIPATVDAAVQMSFVHASIASSFVRAGVVYYVVRVCDQGREWQLCKRYNDFLALEKELQKRGTMGPRLPLPRKGFLGIRRALQKTLCKDCSNSGKFSDGYFPSSGAAAVDRARGCASAMLGGFRGFNTEREICLDVYLAALMGQVQYLAQITPLYLFLHRPAYVCLAEEAYFCAGRSQALCSAPRPPPPHVAPGADMRQAFCGLVSWCSAAPEGVSESVVTSEVVGQDGEEEKDEAEATAVVGAEACIQQKEKSLSQDLPDLPTMPPQDCTEPESEPNGSACK